jgi:hypothetical protein
MHTETIATLVRQAETDYNSGKVTKSQHVQVSLKEDLAKIDAYANSKHISGATDSLGRKKPFFNIVIAAMNIWYRATDIDRANIRIRATRGEDHILQIFYNAKVQEWMKTAKFGVFLNNWGRILAKYGSAILEFVEVDGELVCSVLDWNKIIVDPINFKHAPLIKKLEYTPAELRKKKGYNKEMVKALIENLQTRKLLNGQQQTTTADSIPVYEVHGELSLAQYKLAKGQKPKEGDEDIFFQQMHAVSFVGNGKGTGKDGYDEYTLYCGKEDDPHMITHLIEEDGYILSMGAVKSLFEAQQWTNHDEKAMRDYLDFISKLTFQTADEAFIGRNAINDFELGEVLRHAPNMPLVPMQVGNNGNSVAELRSNQQNWRNQGMETTSTPDAARGNTLPSGTSGILAEQLIQQSSSLFEIMVENKGLAIEEMMTRFVLPYIDKTMDNTDEIIVTLTAEGLKEIDQRYVPAEAVRRHNESFKEAVLNEKEPQPFDPIAGEMAVQKDLNMMGNTRPLSPEDVAGKTWKQLFAGFKKRVEVEVTNEMHNKATLLSDLNATMANLVKLGDVQNARLVLSKIMQETGSMSPAELQSIQSAPQPLPVGGSNDALAGALPVA